MSAWLDRQLARRFLEDDVHKAWFDFVRNMVIAGLVLSLSTLWIKHPSNDPAALQYAFIAWFYFGGIGLFIYNGLHGLKKLREAKVPWWQVSCCIVVLGLPMLGVVVAQARRVL